MTRADTKTAVGEMARHCSAARRTLKYLKYTEEPIIRKGHVKDLLVVHGDTYYPREEENRRSFLYDGHECRSEFCLVFEDTAMRDDITTAGLEYVAKGNAAK